MPITRKRYFMRLIGRIVIFIVCLILCFKPRFYDILEGMNFFNSFYVLHILWLIWIFDIILQILSSSNKDNKLASNIAVTGLFFVILTILFKFLTISL